MYKALYSFKKTHPQSLGFEENDEFIGLPGAAADKNWYYVVTKSGNAGYIPKNYVEQRKDLTLEEFKREAEAIKERIKVLSIGPRERGELIAKIDRSRINFEKTLPTPVAYLANINVIQTPDPHDPGSSGSRSSTPPKSLKKRAAPKPPPGTKSGSSRENSPGKSLEDPDAIQTLSEHNKQKLHKQISRQNSSSVVNAGNVNRRTSIPDPSEEQLRTHARELIEEIRNSTGLSYNVSQSTIHAVLSYVNENFGRLDRNIPALICELEVSSAQLLKDSKEVAKSNDYKVLEKLFEELTKCKEDDQQRNWMLYEDEQKIASLLNHVCDRLQNAPDEASLQVIRRFKYFYVNNLIEYFQMETRWSLKRLLIEVFLLMCQMEPNVISIMLSSVLPLELVQDIYQTKDIERLRSDGILLTVILSSGEAMPVHYFDQIGRIFCEFLLDYIEDPPNREFEVEVCDVFIGVLLAYNLQFSAIHSNIFIETLANRVNTKTFLEKILLLLNREEDPTTVIDGEYTDVGANIEKRAGDVHATQKVIMDIFKHKNCHKLFYTNDLYVLIDIIVRQLSDLSYEDPKRTSYVDMCELVLRHSDYDENLHRFKDLEHCFLRILEEEESKDRRKIHDICKEIQAFNSLV